jgi:hypothetical protein
MRLERTSASSTQGHHADSEKVLPYSRHQIFGDNHGRVYVEFDNFDAGSERLSDFVVSLNWPDVENLVQRFAAMGTAEAKRLQRAATLAAAVEQFVDNS